MILSGILSKAFFVYRDQFCFFNKIGLIVAVFGVCDGALCKMLLESLYIAAEPIYKEYI